MDLLVWSPGRDCPIQWDVSAAATRCPRCDELSELVRRLTRRLDELEDEVARLRGALEEARRAGKRQASPFSKGSPKTDPKRPGRKSGEDHGPAAFRAIPKRVDEIFNAPLPDSCPCCGGGLETERIATQYQTEIPRVDPVVRRFEVHVGRCVACGTRVQGRHPLQTSDALGAAASQLGPHALSLATHLNKVLGATYGKVQTFLEAVHGVTVSRGGLARAMQRVADKLDPTYRDLLAEVRQNPVVYPDETSMRISGRRGWLWAFVTPKTTVYVQRPSRGTDVIEEVLGLDFCGALGHDGWAPCDQLVLADHQQCFAHLLRRCKEMLETASRGAVRFPRAVKALLQDAVALRDRREKISAHGFAVARGRLQGRFDRLMEMRLTCEPNRKLQGHLRRHADQIFTFLHRFDIEATAWMADHAIRPAVLFRKISGGHRSVRGARTHDILISVLRTCRQRLADALDLTRRALCEPSPQPFLIEPILAPP